MSDIDVRNALREWIAETSGKDAAEIDDRTQLFGGGLLKSVHLLDMILLIEELAENDIDIEKLGPASFKDIDTVVAAFFAREAA